MPAVLDAPDAAAWDLRAKCNYLNALVLARDDRYGLAWGHEVVGFMHPGLVRLTGKKPPARRDAVLKALKNGWNTELLLSFPLDHDDLVQPANHWAAVQAYYAVFSITRAWLLCGAGPERQTHHAHLKVLGDTLTGASYVPFPLNVACARWHRGGADVTGLSNEFVPQIDFVPTRRPRTQTYEQYVFSALRSTRAHQNEAKRADWLRANPGKQRRSPALVRQHDAEISATTVVDLLYEMRLQANYRDVEPFTSDGLSADDPRRFLQYLAAVVSTLNFVFENLVSARVGASAMEHTLREVRGPHVAPNRGPFARADLWFRPANLSASEE